MIEVTLDRGLELLAQEKKRGRKAKEPEKDLGEHPEDKKPVQIFKGPYGPYVKHGTTNASLPKDQPLEEVTMEMAIELLAAKKKTPAKKGRKKKGS